MNQFISLDYDSIKRFEIFLSSNIEKGILRTLPPNNKDIVWCVGAVKHTDRPQITLHNLTRDWAEANGFKQIHLSKENTQ